MRRLILLVCAPLALLAQPSPNPHPATSAERRLEGVEMRRALQRGSWLGALPLRNVGPTVMSGRVVDLDVDPTDPSRFYVAYASGGLWLTENNGQSFRPLLDTVATLTLGDIAVHWPSNTVWAGTGENNSSRSSYAGVGLYRSPDGGKTWRWAGLPESQHIGRIVLHPTDPNTAWVAVLGNLYSPSTHRGVYKTTDGGATWAHTLAPTDQLTGAIDLVIDPSNPAILYAATWQRTRRAWNFEEAGAGTGLWKSTDGGATWALISTPTSGFPTGDKVGRIGLTVSAQNPRLLYAVVDHQGLRADPKADRSLITKAKLRDMSAETFVALPPDSLNAFLDANGFPADVNAAKLIERVKAGKLKPSALYDYLYSANEDLFNAPIRGAELYLSRNAGLSWTKTHSAPIEDLFFTYGYYFAQVRVDPRDSMRVYLLGVPTITSADGGRSFSALNSDNSHADHHALWLSPTRPGHLVLGNDGGINISYDYGQTFVHCNAPAVGQFYAVAVDNARPYNVYGGLQDNGVWVGPSTYRHTYDWYSEGQYPYKRLFGGDGMQVQIDPRDNATVYTGLQFGNYVRTHRLTGQPKRITPNHTLGERPYRWNWQTPIHLSVHNPDILYMGAHKVLRSMNKGDSFEAISPDLTRGPVSGDVPYGTLACLVESPLRFGLIWAGSDDGKVHVSRDAGATWQDVSAGLPEWLWVSRIELSRHDTATALVSLNGYRWDHFESYLYRTTDYGRTWTRLGTGANGLPPEPINVVRQDPANPKLIYVGTDHGLYASLDAGTRWMALGHRSLPEVPIHDLAIQARDRELLVGTHGRSLYIAPLKHLQQLTPELTAKALHAFALDTLTYSDGWGRRGFQWSPAQRPTVTLTYWATAAGRVTYALAAENGTLVATGADTASLGLNYQPLVLAATDSAALAKALAPAPVKQTKPDPNAKPAKAPTLVRAGDGSFYLRPGTYTLRLTQGTATAEQKLVIKPARERPTRGRSETHD